MLTDLVDTLRGDPELAANLADAPWGGPAVYTIWAPEHPRPYITLDIDESQDAANREIASGDLIIDVWGDGSSHVALEPIRDRLRSLLDRRIIDTDRGPVRFLWEQDGPEQSDEPQVVRWRVIFDMRRSMTEYVTT